MNWTTTKNKLINLIINNKYYLVLFAIICFAILFRFYNLAWDEGYFFHPDERNTGSAITRIDFKNLQFNPEFFAYGTLPIYIIRIFSDGSFDDALLKGRFISAVFSTIGVLLVFFIIKNTLEISYTNKKLIFEYSLLGALFTAVAPGLIQFAHFATFETFLSIQYLLIVFVSILLIKTKKSFYYILLAIVPASSIATKIVSLVMIPILLLAHVINLLDEKKNITKNFEIYVDNKKYISRFFEGIYFLGNSLLNYKIWISIIIAINFTIIFSPFNLLDFEAFRGSMNYEGPVADGSLLVFYTQQFLNTTPFVYQFFKIFPYIMGWPMTIIGIIVLSIYLVQSSYLLFKNIFDKYSRFNYGIVLVTFVGIFYAVPHMMMYVKWTRYMIPLLPLLIILIVVFGASIHQKLTSKLHLNLYYTIITTLVIFNIIFGVNYFSHYTKPDPRVLSAKWANRNIPANSNILIETADIGIIAWEHNLENRNLMPFNFYDFENDINSSEIEQLTELIDQADYIVLMSNRVYPTKLRLPERYPNAHKFYTQLFDGSLGFELEARFARDTMSEQFYNKHLATSPYNKYTWFSADESYTVFDRPDVLVFRKI
jgi:hypothetical protein